VGVDEDEDPWPVPSGVIEVGRGGRPAGRPRSGAAPRRRHVWIDAVFLPLAITQPDRPVEALESLFARKPIDRVVRFLNEDATLVDEVRLVRSLPTKPALRADWRASSSQSRRGELGRVS